MANKTNRFERRCIEIGVAIVCVAFITCAQYKLKASALLPSHAQETQPSRGPKVILPGHGAEVRSVVFSPSGKMLASGSQDHTVKLWNPETGELLRTFAGHGGELDSIAFSPDGSVLAISSVDAVNFYDPGSGNLIRSVAGCRIAGHSAFSPDGKLLVTKSVSEQNLKLWDVQTGKLFQAFIGHTGDVIRIAFSPDGKLIASIGADNSLKLWEAQTGKVMMNLTSFKYSLVDVAFSPDGKSIATANDTTISFWDAKTGKAKLELHSDYPSADSFPPPVRSITFSPNGELLAVASYDSRFTLLDVATGKPKYNFQQDSRPYSAAFSPDGKNVVTACEPKAIYLWSLETTDLKLKIGNEAESHAVAFSPDGKTIASDGGFFYHAISLWDAQTGKLVRTLTGHEGAITALVFSPDSRILCGAESLRNIVYIWEPVSGEVAHTVELAEASEASSIAFSPDGKVLAVAGAHGDGTIRLVSTQTWQPKRTLLASGTIREENPLTKKIEVVRLGVADAEFSPDGKTLTAIVDEGKTLKVWNVQTGTLLGSMRLKEDMSACGFSPDLKLIVCGSELWDTARNVLVRTLPGPKGVVSLGFSNDGKVLATSGDDGMAVRLWDVQSGKLKSTLKGHMNEVSSAAFSADGQTILTGSHDGTVRLWNVNTGEVKQVLVIEVSRLSSQ
jgi:WD40 repeat protein